MSSTDLTLLEETPPWEWPEDAGETLLAALVDDKGDTDERMLAVQLTGDTTVIDDALASALLVIVNDDKADEELRAQAALALGPALEDASLQGLTSAEGLGIEHIDPDDLLLSPKILGDIQQGLKAIYDDEKASTYLRRRALEAAAHAPGDWQEAAVRKAYDSGDAAWHLTAVFCMRFIPGFDTQIVETLKTDDQELLHEAVCAAGTWAVEEAWDRITGLLRLNGDEQRDVLLAAIEAVAAMRPQEAAEVLAELAESEDEEIALTVAEALDMAQIEDYDEDDDDEPADERD